MNEQSETCTISFPEKQNLNQEEVESLPELADGKEFTDSKAHQ